MGGTYVIWLATDQGVRVYQVNSLITSFEYVKTIGGIGTVIVSFIDQTVGTYIGVDRQVHILRKAPGASSYIMDGFGFMRRWDFIGKGAETLTEVEGVDQNDLLRRRIVAYKQWTDESETGENSETVDDAMKRVFDENFLAGATDSDRQLQALNVTKSADLSEGPVVQMAIHQRNVLEVFQELQAASRYEGPEIFFGIEVALNASSETTFNFKTAANQWAEDRTFPSGSGAIVLSRKRGNLQDPRLSFNYLDSATVLYVGGPGEGPGQTVAEVSDAARVADSVWNRIESFLSGAGEFTDDLTYEGAVELEKLRPIVSFTGTMLETVKMQYGVHWNLGDLVTVNEFGVEFPALIKTVRVAVDDSGRETIEAEVLADWVR